MAKSITIQERGTPIDFTADTLKTALAGRGSAQWIPKEDAQMAAVTIHKNGTYTAEALGVNGIMEAEVDDAGGTAITVTRRDLLGSLPTLTPAIQEGGAPFGFSAHTLKVAAQGGGDVLFVAANLQMGAKTITRAGKYKASSDGLYAWNLIRVDIDDGGGGGGGGGDDDPPAILIVDTPPTLYSYHAGDAIDYTGLIVKAYTATYKLWTDSSHPDGIIPNNELTLPQTADPETLEPGSWEAISDLDTNLEQPIPFGTGGYTLSFKNGRFYIYSTSGADEVRIVRLIRSDGSTEPWFMSKSPFRIFEDRYTSEGAPDGQEEYQVNQTSVYGYPVYYRNPGGSSVSGITSFGTVDIYTNASMSNADMYTIVYGATVGGYKVPVKWARPGDGQVLETHFSINILPDPED